MIQETSGDGYTPWNAAQVTWRVLAEKHAERRYATILNYPSMSEAVRQFGLPTEITVSYSYGNRRKVVKEGKVRVSVLYGAYKRFLSQERIARDIDQSAWLTDGHVAKVSEAYLTWLGSEVNQKAPYAHVTDADQCRWLIAVIDLIAARRIMEAKYRNRDRGAFQDDYARRLIESSLQLRCYLSEHAKIIHRINRAEDRAELVALIGSLSESLKEDLHRLRAKLLLDVDPLPPLSLAPPELLPPEDATETEPEDATDEGDSDAH